MPFFALPRRLRRKVKPSANGTSTPVVCPVTTSSPQSPVRPPSPTIQVRVEDAEATQKREKRTIFHRVKASWGSSQPSVSISQVVEAPQPLPATTNGVSSTTTLPISQSPSKAPSCTTASEVDGKDDHGMDDCVVDEDELFLTVNSPTSNRNRRKALINAAKATASVAKYGLQLVKESSDVLPPLKSVSSGLCFLLDTYEQWVSNKDDMTRLIRRIQQLQEKFETDDDSQDKAEIQRRSALTKQLQEISQRLAEITEENGLRRFAEAGKAANIISGFINDIRDAIMEYQVSLQMFMYKQNNKQIASDEMRDLMALPRARNAGHLSEHHRYCLKGTRVEVFELIESWADDDGALRVYWLNGHAGSGKSTIAQSFSKRMFGDKRLGASFFCSRDFADRSELQFIFPTLSFQLACQFPAFRAHVVQTLRLRPDIGSESLTNQLVELIIEPLEASNISTLIVIDALDECKDDKPASAILSLLARYIHRIPQVKWFITGRPEAPIRSGFRIPTLQPLTQIFILHDVEVTAVEHDIELYLRTRLSEYVQERSHMDLPIPWPSDEHARILVKKSTGLFIFIVTAVTFITSPGHLPDERLELITCRPDENTYEGRSGLDILYSTILEKGSTFAEDDENYFLNLRMVWGCIVTAFNPLSLNGMSSLLNKLPRQISTSLRLYHAVLRVPPSPSEPVRVYHKSFPDYLTDSTRCTDNRFFIDAANSHTQMAIKSLQLMRSKLKKNICNLPQFSMNKASALSHRRRGIGESLEYACRFWAQHLAASSRFLASFADRKEIISCLHEFFEHKVIFWFEVLSLTENLHSSVYSLRDARTWVLSWATGVEKTFLIGAIHDSERFILQFFDCIQESALHLYHSALPQSPTNSEIYTKLHSQIGSGITIRKGLESSWKAKARTIVTRLNKVTCLKFSGDGAKVAAAGNGGLQVFGTTTGECLATMPNPANCMLVEFSQDNTFLLAAYEDRGIRLWDVQTGGLSRNCLDHDFRIWDISFSPNDNRFASVDEAGHIIVWNVIDGSIECRFCVPRSSTRIFCKWSTDTTVITHSSPYGGTFAHSLSGNNSMCLQNPTKNGISILNSTHNGLRVIDRDRNQLRILNVMAVKTLKTLSDMKFPPQPATQSDRNVQLQMTSISPDERYFVLLKRQNELCLYRVPIDEDVPLMQQTSANIYHPFAITSATFSPDSSQIAFGSEDGTVILSSLDTNYEDSVPSTAIVSVCTSPDGQFCAYANKRGAVEICELSTGVVTKTISASVTLRNTDIETMAFSPRNEFLAIHYKKIVTVEGSHYLRLGLLIWDTVNDRHYSQPDMLLPTLAIYPRCMLQYFQGFEKGSGIPESKRNILDSVFLFRALNFNNAVNFQVWGMSPLHLRWDSNVQYAPIAPKWPLSLHISSPRILIQDEDDEGCQVWEIEFNEKNTGFKLAWRQPRYPELEPPSGFVSGNNWIQNEKGERILWVPYDIALPNSDWQERARWLRQLLVLGGREGKTLVVDFNSG